MIRFSLKARLVLISALVLAGSIGLAGALLLHNARQAISAELDSTVDLVNHLIQAMLPRRGYYFEGERRNLGHLISELGQVRHLDISSSVDNAAATGTAMATAEVMKGRK